ncbi:hypothetical protein O181_000682 [Austropuccinia psidii MF-1]|uniref:Uncharacterized protein n=1 Tax=Austropuccinia psidii MF-1 TaxID=1389203 RepID=A0A9Q3B9C5_9BASI|nr:hypothetical protein [Austropuccinia psidii MF-1]
MEVDSEVEMIPQKWKEREKSPQGRAIYKRHFLEIPLISEPEVEPIMSHSNRDKSNSEGSDRHLHEEIQTVLHSLQRQILGNAATNPPRSDELL